MPSIKGSALILLATAANLAAAWPTVSKHAQLVTRGDDVAEEYDYVIVGGGTSGLTVGDRLTASGKFSVLVIEAGDYWDVTGFDPIRMYNITSEPSPALNDRTFFVGIGKGVGGSSLVNGQVWLRGTSDEYDAWKTLGGKGSDWDWKNLLPYFRKALSLNPPLPELAEKYHVKYDMSYWGDGEIEASFGTGKVADQTMIMYNAMAEFPGVTIPEDSGAGKSGLYYYPLAQDDQDFERSYARTAHWDGLERSNYQMVVGQHVDGINFGKKLTAEGVTFRPVGADADAKPVTVKAKREVILAAGAIHTPQILMLSGVGPKSHLEECGIDVKLDLPGVGANFQDHSYIPFIGYNWNNPPATNDTPPQGPGYGADGPPSLVSMTGLPVITPENYKSIASRFAAQDPRDHLPAHYTKEQVEGYRQQQRVFAKLMQSTNVVFNEIMLGGPGGSVQNLHPMSRGDVRLNPADITGTPLVDYRAGSNPIDLEIMVETVKMMRRFQTSEPLQQYEPEEFLPGPEVETDEQILDWVRDNVIPSVFHPVGTTAMMPRKWGGVVDNDLLVHGTKNLRIIDSGVQPVLIGATTCETVYAVAEKVAERILADAGECKGKKCKDNCKPKHKN